MALTKVLITIKTYPTLSEKYIELVCPAGFLEDGSMIRIYPVPFRRLDDFLKYSKFQWITIDLHKRTKDDRPESYSPINIENGFELGPTIESKFWEERCRLVFKKKVYRNMTELINEAKNKNISTSLGVLKPKEILDFYWESDVRDWDKEKVARIKANHHSQGSLFDNDWRTDFNLVRKVPYKFKYKFITEDNLERNIQVIDWEVGALYWNMIKEHGCEKIACEKVRQKYLFDFSKRDLHFFMGTTFSYHKRAPNPFVIIGVFTPPKTDARQMSFIDLFK